MKKIEELEVGQVFEYGKFEWIKLDDTENGVLAITRDELPDTRKFDEDTNDWRESSLRNWLNENFLYVLIDNGAEEDFLELERDLTADDGMKDYGRVSDRLSLITCEEYRKYRNLIPPINNWWWTLTPYSCLEDYSYSVRYVSADGSLDWGHARSGYYGVRPLCNLKSEILVSTIEDEEVEEMPVTEKIKKWFKDRNLDRADPKSQMLKLMEETGELAEGIAKNRPDQIKDSIGDIYVVLTGLSIQLGYNIEECIEATYEEIKDRKGKMIDGVFVKESDL